MKKRNKKKIADINYLDLIPEKNASLRWHTDIKKRVILEVENTGIMNKIAQNLFNKPRFTKVLSLIHISSSSFHGGGK